MSWRIILSVIEDNKKIGSSEGVATGQRNSMDASPDRIRKMYYDALQQSVVNALSKLNI